jgi:hypothetical protein
MPPSPPILGRDAFPAFAPLAGNAHPAWGLPVDWVDEQFPEPVARLIDEHIQAAASSAERVQALSPTFIEVACKFP